MLGFGAVLVGAPAPGAAVVFPSADCAGTLQACIDAAAGGDTMVRPFDGARVRAVSRNGVTALELAARFTVATGHLLDPGADGIALVLTPQGGAPLMWTVAGAQLTANRRRTRFAFEDPSGASAGGLTKLVLKLRRKPARMQARGRSLPLALAGGLRLEMASGESHYGTDTSCAARGRKLACR